MQNDEVGNKNLQFINALCQPERDPRETRGRPGFLRRASEPAKQVIRNLLSLYYLNSKENMNELVIEKKNYVLITRKEYESLQKRASLKTRPEKIFSLAVARAYSKELIRKWAKEK